MIHIEVDTQAEIVRIGQRLERLAFQAPDILRLSINAAARKVRKQITKDAAETYTTAALRASERASSTSRRPSCGICSCRSARTSS